MALTGVFPVNGGMRGALTGIFPVTVASGAKIANLTGIFPVNTFK